MAKKSAGQSPGLGKFLFWWWLITLALWAGNVALGFTVRSALRDRRRGEESASWPTASGRVLDTSLSRSPGYRAASTCKPRISYRYEVDGRAFDGKKVTFEDPISSQVCAALLEDYPRDKEVRVHYDPREPSVSVLVPGGSPSLLLLVTAAGGLIMGTAIATYLSYLGLRAARSGGPARGPARGKARS